MRDGRRDGDDGKKGAAFEEEKKEKMQWLLYGGEKLSRKELDKVFWRKVLRSEKGREGGGRQRERERKPVNVGWSPPSSFLVIDYV